MKPTASPSHVSGLSPQSATDAGRHDRRPVPPAAITVLLAAWGYEFTRRFLELGLPTLLAPGNVPALARMRPCEFIVLTSEQDEPFVRWHPTFRALSEVCNARIRTIDHLITGENYSTTLTLAYAEAVRAAGPAMTETCFFFLVSDYIVADGALGHVAERVFKGASGVLAGNFQVVEDSGLPWLRAKLDRAAPALVLSPRELMRWGLANLHPIVAANTVNFPLTHNRHTNRLFWRVDSQTLVGRFYLMHPIAVRPETTEFTVGASFDYSFIPEMCPSGNVQVITDSDEYLVVEIQPREHEAALLRPGPLRPRALARTLSEWTTERHRQNAHHSVLFHAGDLPETLPGTIAAADRFVDEVERSMRRRPQAHRGHPYWIGAFAAHGDATGMRLAMRDQWLALGLPDDLLTRFQHPLGQWLVETAAAIVFGRPPSVRPWHPRWLDYALVWDEVRSFLQDGCRRLLVLADRATPFTVSLADGGERVVRMRTTQFLGHRPGTQTPLARSFDLCLLEVGEADLAQSDRVVDRVVPLMKPGGQILVVVYNRRTKSPLGFVESIGFHAPRLMRGGTALQGIRVAKASLLRWYVSRAITNVAVTVYYRPWIGLPLAGLGGGVLGLANVVAGALDRGRSARELGRRALATSAHILLGVDAAGHEAYRYTPDVVLDEQLHRHLLLANGAPTCSPVSRPFVVDALPMVPVDRDLGARSPFGKRGHAAGGGPSGFAETAATLPVETSETRESQCARCVDPRDQDGLASVRPGINEVWYDEPRRLGILLSRYKFVAKMLSGRHDVGEVGCGDAFGARVVLQEVDRVTVYHLDPVCIQEIRQRYSEHWPIAAQLHDIVAGPLPRQHDGLYSLDVVQHIPRQDEHLLLVNLSASLSDDGVLVLGSPFLESQAYASPLGGAGRVNCRSGEELKALLLRYFKQVFLFSMNEDVVHTGFYRTAHYLIAVCCGKK